MVKRRGSLSVSACGLRGRTPWQTAVAAAAAAAAAAAVAVEEATEDEEVMLMLVAAMDFLSLWN